MAGASGLYLASYSAGGLSGQRGARQIFDRFGWPACAAGIGLGPAAGGVYSACMLFNLRLRPSIASQPFFQVRNALLQIK
jgi:hypothetical protein